MTRTDGTTVDVRLSSDYEVIVIESDTESPDNDDTGD